MSEEKNDFPLGKVVICAIIYTIIAQIIHTVGAMATMSFYTDSIYHKVWSIFMMPQAGPPPLSFIFLSLLFGLVNAIIFVTLYVIFKNSIPGKTPVQKGLMYGLLVTLLVGVAMFSTFLLLINLPAFLLVYWLFEGFIIYLIGGLITARIIK